MATEKTKMKKQDLKFNKNEDAMKLKLSALQRKIDKIHLGGGMNKIKKHHSKGKLTARERISLLLDKDSDYVEMGEFAGYGMYEQYGGCPSGGVVIVIGYVSGKQCVVVANDATVKAGAWFPITGKKKI
jgi:acetyl-CoA carboxylase carboxyltransferase component